MRIRAKKIAKREDADAFDSKVGIRSLDAGMILDVVGDLAKVFETILSSRFLVSREL